MIDHLIEKLDGIMKEIARHHDAVVAYDNNLDDMQNKVAEMLEVWSKREEENHLLLVKILEIVSKIAPPDDKSGDISFR